MKVARIESVGKQLSTIRKVQVQVAEQVEHYDKLREETSSDEVLHDRYSRKFTKYFNRYSKLEDQYKRIYDKHRVSLLKIRLRVIERTVQD